MKVAVLVLMALSGATVGTPVLAHAGDVENGKQVFRQSCRTCHAVDVGTSRLGGPNLSALTKDGPALLDSDYAYSDEFKAAAANGLIWSKELLDAFLKDPESTVPGVRMPIGVVDEKQRTDLLAYLLSLKK